MTIDRPERSPATQSAEASARYGLAGRRRSKRGFQRAGRSMDGPGRLPAADAQGRPKISGAIADTAAATPAPKRLQAGSIIGRAALAQSSAREGNGEIAARKSTRLNSSH